MSLLHSAHQERDRELGKLLRGLFDLVAVVPVKGLVHMPFGSGK
jgi:hypothetical protein